MDFNRVFCLIYIHKATVTNCSVCCKFSLKKYKLYKEHFWNNTNLMKNKSYTKINFKMIKWKWSLYPALHNKLYTLYFFSPVAIMFFIVQLDDFLTQNYLFSIITKTLHFYFNLKWVSKLKGTISVVFT